MSYTKAMVTIIAFVVLGCTSQEKVQPEVVVSSGVVTVNGIDFEYFIEGTGRTCIVVGDASRTLSSQLKEHFRLVHLYSRLGTPEERVGDVSSITMDTLVDDIEQGRQMLGLGKVCVLGHSISGIVALEYARKYPQYATHVIMIGTPPFMGKRYAPAVSAFWEEHASEERKKILEANWAVIGADSLKDLSATDAALLEYVTNAPMYFHDPAYDPAWLVEGAYWNIPAFNHLFNVIMADYDLGMGPIVQTPVFLAIGRDDYDVPFTLWDTERGKIPNLSYNLFQQSGHYPMLEEQELFDDKLLAWIQEQNKVK
jgi:proline iminopeptidase